MPLDRQVEIPAEVLVRCPLVNFDLRRARGCDGCEHMRGLTELADRGTFHARFQVRCAWPQDRQLFRLAEGS